MKHDFQDQNCGSSRRLLVLDHNGQEQYVGGLCAVISSYDWAQEDFVSYGFRHGNDVPSGVKTTSSPACVRFVLSFSILEPSPGEYKIMKKNCAYGGRPGNVLPD